MYNGQSRQRRLIIKEGVTVCGIPFSALRDACVQNQRFCTEESKAKRVVFVGRLDLLWLGAQRTDNLGHERKSL